jgi:hypothetical protein
VKIIVVFCFNSDKITVTKQQTEDNMKTSFTHKDHGDKVLVTLFANGNRVASIWRTKENSFFENLKEAEQMLLLRYQIDNSSEEQEEGE